MNRRKFLISISLLVVTLSLSTFAFTLAQNTDTVEDLIATVTLKPIDQLLNSELVVTTFANDGSASLPIETSIPVACSVVYGQTPEFGSLSVDLDMNGGTHTLHNPLLTNLEPETSYYFRVQGIDDAGVIYLSEVMTFTTPPRNTSAVTNLASPELGAEVIGYSSAFGGADVDENWGADSAFDGSSNTAWSSDGDGDNAWIEVRLAQRSHIERIAFWSREMSDGTAQVFEFNVTNEAGETYGPFTLQDASQLYEFEVDFEAITLRFDVVNSSGGNTGAIEIGVYGQPIDG